MADDGALGGGDAGQRAAALALATGTLFWGCGFTWAKAGGEAVQRAAGLAERDAFGPMLVLAWRFLLGGLVWLVVFPGARSGWSARGMLKGVLLGALLAFALIVQHIGLDRTSETVSAFLTSLTILFVPILMTVALRKPPKAVLWIGVVLATAGVWLMTGATPTGFGLGELLGLLCSFGFSLYIVAINAVLPSESPWRMTAAQFLTVGLACFATCAVLRRDLLAPQAVHRVLASPDVWRNVLLLMLFPTLGAFGLLTHFQHRLDATRAALIYLLEPVIAAAYAALAAHRQLGRLTLVGAGLILTANLLAEVIAARKPAEATVLVD